MDCSQVLRKVAVAVLAWSVVALSHGVAGDAKTEKSIQDALADADRYAGGFSGADAYVANAWERAVDGWVRGGYTLVSGDVHTDVRYVVDPTGEMRVMARRPGVTPAAASAPGKQAAVVEASTHVARHRLGSPLLGGYRPPFYQRLVHHVGGGLGLSGGLGLDDDDVFDDVDLDADVDDGHVDEDEPFFFDMATDNWNSSPVDDWARFTQAEQDGGIRRGPDPARARAFVGCRSTRCHAARAGMGGRLQAGTRPGGLQHGAATAKGNAGTAATAGAPAGLPVPPATREDPTTGAPVDAVGAASFQSGHYDLRLRTLKQ